MWERLKSMLLGKREVSKPPVHIEAPAPRRRIAAECPGRVLDVAQPQVRHEEHASTLPAKTKDVPTRAAENNITSCRECRKAFTHQHRILEKRLIQIRKDVCTVKEIAFALACAHRNILQATANLVPGLGETITRQVQTARHKIESQIGRVEQLIAGRIRRDIQAVRQELDNHVRVSADGAQSASEQNEHLREWLDGLNRTCGSLGDQQRLILERLTSIEEAQATDSPPDQAIEQAWRQLKDFDEFIATLRSFADDCRSDCFANKFAAETISRLQGIRTEAVNFLAIHDAFLIDSMDRFDPARHCPLGTCSRPGQVTGDGIIQRVGLARRNGNRERVCQPALVTLFDDVEV